MGIWTGAQLHRSFSRTCGPVREGKTTTAERETGENPHLCRARAQARRASGARQAQRGREKERGKSRASRHPNDPPGVGADSVELVDEGDAGHVVALHLAVDGDALALHAADAGAGRALRGEGGEGPGRGGSTGGGPSGKGRRPGGEKERGSAGWEEGAPLGGAWAVELGARRGRAGEFQRAQAQEGRTRRGRG